VLNLFRAAILLNALLLFLVQPMFAKMALPLLGGSPSVWTTCMLFFQATLLLGYLYSHLSVKALGIRRQSLVHALLVVGSVLLLPIGVAPEMSLPAGDAPTRWLLLVLAGSVGLPFFLLSTTAPLLQRWFAARHEGSNVDPYRLYAASNVGSLGGLLAYPALIEPFLSIPVQRVAWSIGYAGTAAVIAACGLLTLRATTSHRESAVTADALFMSARARWIALAAVPSALMLAVTVHISTDIAAVPLMWIAPLALYLSTFIIVFSPMGSRVLPIARRALPLTLLPLVLLLVAQTTAHLWFVIPLHLAVFWLLSLLCHAELSRTRPDAAHLTEFYLWLAVGGMVGGIFSAFIAPRLFVEVGEYPVLIAVSALAIARPSQFVDLVRQRQLLVRPVLAGVLGIAVIWLAAKWSLEPGLLLPLLGLPALLCFSVSRQSASFGIGIALLLAAGSAGEDAWGNVLYSERTFFGVYRVSRSADGRLTALFHGTTLHGSERRQENDAPPEPLAYYHRKSPIGDVFAALDDVRLQSVGVVGLGVGSLAAYAKEAQDWLFYEIDPAVERIARDSRYFTFLKSCGSSCRVLIGDGRLLIDSAGAKHQVLVLDAFSSDAIPIHLLTAEAIEIYLEHLSGDGLLAFHISNRHFDLRPVLGRVAATLGLVAIVRDDTSRDVDALGAQRSRWVVMARSAAALAGLPSSSGWMPLNDDGAPVWTDDFSNVLSALRWR
jgi:hypothetical protein